MFIANGMLEHILLIGSIRIALLCYAIHLGLLAVGRADTLRIACNGGGLLLLIMHVLAAYASHDWSHARAVEQTAIDTQATLGFSFGAGIYFNHLFALLWLVDFVCEATCIRLPRHLHLAIHAYLVVIAINGAIVFESGPTRWFGLVAVAALSVVILFRTRIGDQTSGDGLAEID